MISGRISLPSQKGVWSSEEFAYAGAFLGENSCPDFATEFLPVLGIFFVVMETKWGRSPSCRNLFLLLGDFRIRA